MYVVTLVLMLFPEDKALAQQDGHEGGTNPLRSFLEPLCLWFV